MIAAALVVFAIAFILDTGAVARLFWAALTGQFGPWARIAAIAALILLLGVTVIMLSRPAELPPAKVRKKPARSPVRTEVQPDRNDIKDGDPAALAPVAKRRRKRPAGVVADQPS